MTKHKQEQNMIEITPEGNIQIAEGSYNEKEVMGMLLCVIDAINAGALQIKGGKVCAPSEKKTIN